MPTQASTRGGLTLHHRISMLGLRICPVNPSAMKQPAAGLAIDVGPQGLKQDMNIHRHEHPKRLLAIHMP